MERTVTLVLYGSDDYRHTHDEDRVLYNFEVRNSLRLSKAQFYGLTTFNTPKYNNIALLLTHRMLKIYGVGPQT